MNRLRLYLLVLTALLAYTVKTDEGMWLLQLTQRQHSIDMMKKQGLRLEAQGLYNPNGVSLKNAVGISGGGCTGEIISPEGLTLTNYHCGYSSIQQHSSVEYDYLTDGFWATSRDQELPTPGLKFTFIERIEDITDIVNAKITVKEITEFQSSIGAFLEGLAKELCEKSDLKDKKGIVPQTLPFYAGSKFYLFYKGIYPDVRMVATPSSSVGKFGGEIDNWMWPRHTGDPSMFRIYVDANGKPTEYSTSNTPLKTKKHSPISVKGLKEGDYAMITGFPGRISRYLVVSEVKERMESTNEPRIRIRGARLAVLKEVINASDKIRIQYANKYAGSSNYWKNLIGMSRVIIDNDVLGTKAKQEVKFTEYAKAQNSTEYANVVKKIDDLVAQTAPLSYQLTCLIEVFLRAIEFGNSMLTKTREALVDKSDSLIKVRLGDLKGNFKNTHNKNYDHEVDHKVVRALLLLYAEMIPINQRPAIYKVIEQKYKGDYNRFADNMYDKSIFANQANSDESLKKPIVKAIDEDLASQYAQPKYNQYGNFLDQLKELDKELALLHKTYTRGLGKMRLPAPSYPDANFTIRLTHGNVKPYDPKDGVHYNYYTITKGVSEKENPEDREFVVPVKLKELIEKKDYGCYALPNGDMSVCFLSTNDITGGNPGSPVLNENGELIGCASDGNREFLSGGINFDDNLRRCINLDICYVLFIFKKLGNCGHLINEVTIVE